MVIAIGLALVLLVLCAGWFALASVLSLNLLVVGTLGCIALAGYVGWLVAEERPGGRWTAAAVVGIVALLVTPTVLALTTSLGPRLVDQSVSTFDLTLSILDSMNDSGAQGPGTPDEQYSTPDAPEEQLRADDCEPGYSGCVPAGLPDVDCDELSDTDITVHGDDPYDLDRDNNGIACESY